MSAWSLLCTEYRVDVEIIHCTPRTVCTMFLPGGGVELLNDTMTVDAAITLLYYRVGTMNNEIA